MESNTRVRSRKSNARSRKPKYALPTTIHPFLNLTLTTHTPPPHSPKCSIHHHQHPRIPHPSPNKPPELPSKVRITQQNRPSSPNHKPNPQSHPRLPHCFNSRTKTCTVHLPTRYSISTLDGAPIRTANIDLKQPRKARCDFCSRSTECQVSSRDARIGRRLKA